MYIYRNFEQILFDWCRDKGIDKDVSRVKLGRTIFVNLEPMDPEEDFVSAFYVNPYFCVSRRELKWYDLHPVNLIGS